MSVAKGGHVVWVPGGTPGAASGGPWSGGLGGRGGLPSRAAVVAHWPVVAVGTEDCWHCKQVCGPGWSHGMAGGSPAARVVMLCGPGGAPGRGLRGALAEGASAVPGEGASRAAVGDPLAEGRCASEG